MRSWTLSTVIVGVVGGALLASVPAAAVGDANAGSIKVKTHSDSIYPPENDPHITGCPASFDVYAYDFSNQQVSWTIDQQPPTGNAIVATGDTKLTPESPAAPQGALYEGYLIYGDVNLPSGHYKIVAHEDGTNATGKQKVFWIDSDCPTPTPSSTPTPAVSGSPTPTPTPTPATSTTPTPSGGVSGGGVSGGGNGGTGTGTGSLGAGSVGGATAGGNASGASGGVLAATATLGAAATSGPTGAVLAETGLPIGTGALGGFLFLIGAGITAARRRLIRS